MTEEGTTIEETVDSPTERPLSPEELAHQERMANDPYRKMLREQGFSGDPKVSYTLEVVSGTRDALTLPPTGGPVRNPILTFETYQEMQEFVQKNPDAVPENKTMEDIGLLPYAVNYDSTVYDWNNSLTQEQQDAQEEAFDSTQHLMDRKNFFTPKTEERADAGQPKVKEHETKGQDPIISLEKLQQQILEQSDSLEKKEEEGQQELSPDETRERQLTEKIHALEAELESLQNTEGKEKPSPGLTKTLSEHIQWGIKFMEWMDNPFGRKAPGIGESSPSQNKDKKPAGSREGVSKWRTETLATLDELITNLPQGVDSRVMKQFEKFATIMSDYDYAIFTKNIERLKDEYRSTGDRPALDAGLSALFRDPLKGLEEKKK